MFPKIIHQIWLQGEQNIPKKYLEFIKIWKELNPEYDYKFWNSNDIDNLFKLYPELNNYYNKIENYYNKANIGRYLIMAHYGGIYCDIDTFPLKNINELFIKEPELLNYDIIINYRNNNININSGIIISSKNNTWIECINHCYNRQNLNNFISEPYGYYGFNDFFLNKKGNIKILPFYYMECKEILNNYNQYIIHLLDHSFTQYRNN